MQAMLVGMPLAADLRRAEVDGEVLIAVGSRLLFRYAAADAGLRNVAAVTLPELGFTGRRVAEVLGITEEYVSMLRARVRRDGSAALMRRKGRPPALGERQLATARRMRAEGRPDTAIASRLGVHAATIVRALGRRDDDAPAGLAAPAAEQAQLDQDAPAGSAGAQLGTDPVVGTDPVLGAGTVEARGAVAVLSGADAEDGQLAGPCRPVAVGTGLARLEQGQVRSRYAGAMLLFPYLHRVGAEAIFARLTGGPARRYDDLAVLSTATVGFALGIDTVEGSKHLRRTEAGAAVGLVTVPELATLRARLSALADRSDPLGLQRTFAAGMLSADPAADPVYFVDDHFVPYSGARPVGKGWNTKRRHAQPGGTTPCSSTPAAEPSCSAAANRPGWSRRCPVCSASSVRYSARTCRSCSASTAAGPTRARSPPAEAPARTGSPTGAPRWSKRPPHPGGPGPCATDGGSA